MKWKVHLLILGVFLGLVAAFALHIHSARCGGGSLFIGACEIAQFFLVFTTILFSVNLAITSCIIVAFSRRDKKKKKKTSISDVIGIYLASIAISVTLVSGEFGILYLYAASNEVIIQPYRDRTNYQVLNFSEHIIDSNPLTGPHKSIQATVTLQVKKEGRYNISAYIYSPQRRALFRGKMIDPNRSEVDFDSDTLRHIIFYLEPTEELMKEKRNGPYNVTIQMTRKSGLPQRSQGIDREDRTPSLKVFVTSDTEIPDREFFGATKILDKNLVTRAYQYTDFIEE